MAIPSSFLRNGVILIRNGEVDTLEKQLILPYFGRANDILNRCRCTPTKAECKEDL